MLSYCLSRPPLSLLSSESGSSRKPRSHHNPGLAAASLLTASCFPGFPCHRTPVGWSWRPHPPRHRFHRGLRRVPHVHFALCSFVKYLRRWLPVHLPPLHLPPASPPSRSRCPFARLPLLPLLPLLSLPPCPLVLAAAFPPPPPHPKTPPHLPFRCRTFLLLEAPPLLARAWPLRLLLHPRLLNPAFSVDGDGDVQTHDGPVDKAELATVPTTLLGSTGRNPEK